MRAGVALGSNLGDRFGNLRAARKAIVDLAGVMPPILSSLIYETDPVNCEPGAGKFLNAVVEFGYEGEPADLLRKLKEIESALGRLRAREHKRRAAEHSGAGRADRKARVESARQNFSSGTEKRLRVCHQFEFTVSF